MISPKFIKFLCIALPALSFFTSSADDHNFNNMTLKGRVGRINTKAKINTGSDSTAANQKFKDGYIGEVGISYFFHKNIAFELSAGAGYIDFKNNSNAKKNLFFIPVTGMA